MPNIFLFDTVLSLRWQDVADIVIVAFIIYRLILFIRGTRAMQMLVGVFFLAMAYFAARVLEFITLYWLLGTFLSSTILILIIIFQRDIRRALTQVGKTPFAKHREETERAIDEIVGAAKLLALRKIGCLIAIERETGLREYLESGYAIDARLSRELLISIFLPDSPLHDGGVVISRGRVLHAGCLLPLTRNPHVSNEFGTRHRAAIGLSEETDAIIIVVSEETRRISLVQHGVLTTDYDERKLRDRLHEIFAPKEFTAAIPWKSWLIRP